MVKVVSDAVPRGNVVSFLGGGELEGGTGITTLTLTISSVIVIIVIIVVVIIFVFVVFVTFFVTAKFTVG